MSDNYYKPKDYKQNDKYHNQKEFRKEYNRGDNESYDRNKSYKCNKDRNYDKEKEGMFSKNRQSEMKNDNRYSYPSDNRRDYKKDSKYYKKEDNYEYKNDNIERRVYENKSHRKDEKSFDSSRRNKSYSESSHSDKNSRSRSREKERERGNKFKKQNEREKIKQSLSRSRSSSSSYKAIKRPSNRNKPKRIIDNSTTSQYISNNSEFQTQSESILKGKEISNTLMIINLGPDISLNIIEEVFREKCLDLQTSMPEDFRFIESIRVAYIIFPSVSAATKIFEFLMGSIYINGNYYTLEFTPNLSNNPYTTITNKPSVTYVTSVTDNSAYTTSMETTVHEDWICEFCDCKNFSKRVACFKCKRPKTLNCRIIPVIKQKTTVMGEGGQVPPSTSLLIRGNIIKETNETELLESFGQYGQVKDIRMVADKITAEPKDYAFVEYFTIEESTLALNQIKRNPVKMRGNPIFVTFSKIRRPEDLVDHSNRINLFSQQNMDYELMMPPSNQALNSLDAYNVYQDSTLNYPVTNILNSINLSSLSQEDQNKMKNISDLQNLIQSTQTKVNSLGELDNRGQTNLVREKELTEREKVELEMKKWKNSQKKIDIKKKNEEIENKISNIKTGLFDFSHSIDENEYESVISVSDKMKAKVEFENYNQQIIDLTKSFNVPTTTLDKNENNFICHLCQRRFPTADKLKIHETMSSFHKDNLKKLAEKSNN